MEEENKRKIADKFSELWKEEDVIFDDESLRNSFDKLDIFQKNFNPFFEKLEREIKSLPDSKLVYHFLGTWEMELEKKIKKAKRKEELSGIGKIFLSHRKKLLARLSAIKSDLVSIEIPVKALPLKEKESPLSFTDIFIPADWKPFIDALYKVDNPVINEDYKFIGKPNKHKGVVCSWMIELQNKGKIDKKFTRQQLAEVLNEEIKGLNLGKDGKTFSNFSQEYENEYKSKLKRSTKLLP